jgi:hypothetical protein
MSDLENYLSDDIVIKDGHMYHENKIIKKHNWHLKLEELGWKKLHKQWISKLNKLHNPYPTNSLFGSLECGSDGDCLFHCIAYALNSQLDTFYDTFYDSTDIRKRVSDSVSEDQFNDIITCYRSMKDLDDFDESWDPYSIETLDEFKEQLNESGHHFWGDHISLQLICQTFDINIFILSQNEWTSTYEIYPFAHTYDKSKKTIIVLHENEIHFTLVGHFQGNMLTYFTHDNLPLEIQKLYNLIEN